MKLLKLGKNALVKTGLVLARKAAEPDADAKYEYKQINMKSIKADGSIAMEELESYSSLEELGDNYLTQTGDIVVKLTSPNTAVFITEEWANLVVSSHFCIIRMASPDLLAEYVHWYLNSDFAKSASSTRLLFGNLDNCMAYWPVVEAVTRLQFFGYNLDLPL